jgi:hypothetical protein
VAIFNFQNRLKKECYSAISPDVHVMVLLASVLLRFTVSKAVRSNRQTRFNFGLVIEIASFQASLDAIISPSSASLVA